MRLVGIAVVGGGLAPVDLPPPIDGTEHPLQPADARVALRCQADGGAEVAVECLRKHSDALGDLADRDAALDERAGGVDRRIRFAKSEMLHE